MPGVNGPDSVAALTGKVDQALARPATAAPLDYDELAKALLRNMAGGA